MLLKYLSQVAISPHSVAMPRISSKLVIVTPMNRGAVPNADVIGGLFDLTPAEARVARMMGKHAAEAAGWLVCPVTG
jgi:hypothetical protein